MRSIKPFLLLVCGVIAISRLQAQTSAGDVKTFPLGASQMSSMVDPYWKSSTSEAGLYWEKMEGVVSGTLFYSDEWQNGYVLLSNGKAVRDLPLRYNIYSGEIFFKIDSQVRVIDPALPVKEFGFNAPSDHTEKMIIFRNGYPSIGSNTPATFYQAVVTGSWSVLKHTTKRISNKTDLTRGQVKVVNDSESWYLYDSSANKIVVTRPTKKGLLEAMPQYADRIQHIVKQENLSFRTDSDWVILFQEMKNPAQ